VLASYRVAPSFPAATSAATTPPANSSAVNSNGPSPGGPSSTGASIAAPTPEWAHRSWSGWGTVLGAACALAVIATLATLLLSQQSQLAEAQSQAQRNFRALQFAQTQSTRSMAALGTEQAQRQSASRQLENLRAAWQEKLRQPAPPPGVRDLTGQTYRIRGWPHPEVIAIGPDRLLLLEPATSPN